MKIKKQKLKYLPWQEALKKVFVEPDEYGYENDCFGHNIEFSLLEISNYLKKLERYGCKTITVMNNYSVLVELPTNSTVINVLIFILTTSPMPSLAKHNKSANTLLLEWYV